MVSSCSSFSIRALGDTLARWHNEIIARFDTGASNGPTETQ
jgi:transposase